MLGDGRLLDGGGGGVMGTLTTASEINSIVGAGGGLMGTYH